MLHVQFRDGDAASTGKTWDAAKGYVLAAGAAALTLLARQVADPYLKEHHPFAFFLVPVLLAAWASGWKPASLALALGFLAADYFFIHPRNSLGLADPEQVVGALFYLAAGALGISLFESLRTARSAVAVLAQTNARLVAEETARREAEAGRALLAAIVESSDDAVISADPDGTILSWNPAAERLFGYTADEAIGRSNFLLVVPPDRLAESRERVVRVRQGERLAALETVRLRKDGSTVQVSVTVSAVRSEGRTIALSAVYRDITEQLQLEEQLRQSQKMETAGHLAGGIAHDFNNLLTVINGYSELLLLQLPNSEPSRGMLQEIHKAGERAVLLTRQLLVFSRQAVIAPKVLDLNEIVQDAEKLLRRLIGEDIALMVALTPDLGLVRADAGHVQQVIMNLAVNARDAMPTGGRLTIVTQNVELSEGCPAVNGEVRPGRYVLLAVSDTGCGMTAEVLARIFEPFFTTKGVGKGTGLGLSTVYGIVQQSEGHITVHSEPGVGTEFKVYLPRVDDAVTPSGGPSREMPVPRGDETVLLVEDEESVRLLSRRVLTESGYTVLEASDGGEALHVAAGYGEPIHLLVSDVVMPELGGRDLAVRLAASRPEMKVLFLSGYTDDAVVRHGVLQAEMAFLQKPFTPGALARKVREVLEQNGQEIACP